MGEVVQLAEHRSRNLVRRADGPLVTKRKLAEELSRSERTIELWQKDPEFPVHRFGAGTVRYRLSEVEAWFASRPDK